MMKTLHRFRQIIFLLLLSKALFAQTSWEKIKQSSIRASNTEFVAANGYVFVRGVYRSANQGQSWEKCGTQSFVHFFIQQNKIIACTPDWKIWQSTDWGDTWSLLIATPVPDYVENIALTPNGTVLARSTEAVYRFNNNTQNWENTISFFASNTSWWVNGNHIWLACWNGLFKSVNSGQSWVDMHMTVQPATSVIGHGDTIFANSFGKLYRSVNYGTNWTAMPGPEIAVDEWQDNCWYSVFPDFILRSCNGGTTWDTIGHDLNLPGAILGKEHLITFGNRWLVSSDHGVLISEEAGKSFVISGDFPDDYFGSIDPFFFPRSFTAFGNHICFSDISDTEFGDETDSSWFVPLFEDYITPFQYVVEIAGKVYGLSGSKMYVSASNDLVHWEKRPLPFTGPSDQFYIGENFYTVQNFQFYESTDKALTWHLNGGSIPSNIGFPIRVLEDALFLFDFDQKKVLRSMDAGISWDPLTHPLVNSQQNNFFNSLYSSGSGLFMQTGTYYLASLDKGQNWINLYPELPLNPFGQPVFINKFLGVGDQIFATTPEGVLHRKTGGTWVYEDLPKGNYFNLYDGAGFVYVLRTDTAQIWRHAYNGLLPAKEPQEASSAFSIRVSPNPASGEVLFDFGAPSVRDLYLRIWSQDGTLIHSSVISEGQQGKRIPIERLKQGVYYWSVYGAGHFSDSGYFVKM